MTSLKRGFQLFTLLTFALLFLACGGNSGSKSSPPPPEIVISEKVDAFNTYSAQTFSSSTCTPLAIEVPSGIFVSTQGKPTATGTQNDPLDLATALSANSPAQAGDTIWIDEGVYKGSFVSTLSGNSAHPISVKPLPGKRVVLDGRTGEGDVLRIDGQWSNYYGLEITSSATEHTSAQRGSSPTDLKAMSGVTVLNGNDTKVIDFIVHDVVGSGFSTWSSAPNSELYGNIIYNNGWSAPDRGHGHAIYAQNKTGFKKLTQNIIFFGYGTGIHVYTEGGQINGFDIQDNTWFMTGASDLRDSQLKDTCLVGGFQPVINLNLANNLGYTQNGRGTRLGYSSSVTGQSATLSNNYLSENLWVIGSWSTFNATNTVVHRDIDGNASSYISDGVNGNVISATPPTSGNRVFIKANAYDPRRARITIFNYDNADTVAVDASSILKIGEAYRIHNVFGLFNKPIQTGIYDGTPINVKMGTVSPPQPTGNPEGISHSNDPQKTMGSFILTHAACS